LSSANVNPFVSIPSALIDVVHVTPELMKLILVEVIVPVVTYGLDLEQPE
jgi:hypothetical protein